MPADLTRCPGIDFLTLLNAVIGCENNSIGLREPAGDKNTIAVPDIGSGKASLAKKLHIKNYGCQMNVYDLTRMVDVLASWPPVHGNAEDADLVILNTCHPRRRPLKNLPNWAPFALQKERRNGGPQPMMIGVAGKRGAGRRGRRWCRAPYVTQVFGPQTYHRLPEMVAQGASRRHRSQTAGPRNNRYRVSRRTQI